MNLSVTCTQSIFLTCQPDILLVLQEHVPGISPALAIDATPECPSDPNDSAPSSSSSNHQASVSSGLSSVTSQMDDKDDDYIADFLMEDSATFGSEWEYERVSKVSILPCITKGAQINHACEPLMF